MIDIATERLLNLNEAAKLLPSARKGRPVHPATIWRQIASGKLEGLHVGNRWITSVEAIQRYLEEQTEAALRKIGRHPKGERLDGVRHHNRREAELARIADECEAIGL